MNRRLAVAYFTAILGCAQQLPSQPPANQTAPTVPAPARPSLRMVPIEPNGNESKGAGPFEEGTRVATRSGLIEIRLGTLTLVHMEPNSELRLESITPSRIGMAMEGGTLLVQAPQGAPSVAVRTHDARIAPGDGGICKITWSQSLGTVVEVRKGSAEVSTSEGEEKILAGHSICIGPCAAPASVAAEPGNKKRKAEAQPRHAQVEPKHNSRAVPVAVKVQPLSTGDSFTLKATCDTLSRAECARIAKPTSVAILRDCDPQGRCRELTPHYGVKKTDGSDSSISLQITLLDEEEQGPWMRETELRLWDVLRVTYGDGARIPPLLEPVVPGKGEVKCCWFGDLKVWANAPIGMGIIPYLEVTSATGVAKPWIVDGVLEGAYDTHPGWWKFDLRTAPYATLTAGDSITISAIVHGPPQVLVKGTYLPDGTSSGSSTAMAPAPAAPGTPAVNQAASGQGQPWVATTGSCRNPRIGISSTGDQVRVELGCRPGDLSKLVLYVDNKPVSVKWTPSPDLVYLGDLSKPLPPFASVKALQFDPPQVDANSPAVVFEPQTLSIGPTLTWVPQPTPRTNCKPPEIQGTLSAAGPVVVKVGCLPSDAAGLVLYIDNEKKEVQWIQAKDQGVFIGIVAAGLLQPFQSVKVLEFDPPQNREDSRAVVVAGAAPAAPAPAPVPVTSTLGCAAPYIPNAPGPVDSVSVVLGCLPGDPTKDLHVFIDGKAPDGAVTWLQQAGVTPITYTAKLPSKLAPGQSIKVTQTNPPQRDPDSPVVVATSLPSPPSTIFVVQEGATTVSGTASGLDKVRVQLVDGADVKSQAQDASVDATTGLFNATFTSPLQAGQQLRVFGVSKSGTPSDSATPVEVQPFGLDWGRVRGYFTAGLILSNNNSQFNLTNANAFMGFNLDKSWLGPSRAFNSINGGFRERFRVHTYFDARLTAIATGTSGTTASSTPTLSAGSPSGTTGTAGSGSGAAGTTTNPSPNPTTQLSNGQAASLQVGAYLPIVFHQWDHKDRSYSLYVAPIAKVGLYTLTSAGSATSQAAENANRSNQRFFPFFGYGLRLGHYHEYKTWDGRIDRSRSPEQLSYLDVSVGKWANFEYLAPFNYTPAAVPTCTVPASDATTAACSERQRLWRYGFEGILVIPNTPLIVGLSANISAQKPRSSTPGAIFLTPPDDLRFLFGVRFDASKLTGILSKLGGQ